MTLNEKLTYLRKENGLSQIEVSEKLAVSRQAVSRWETGSAVPSTENLKYLGRLYNVPLEYLLHDDAPEPSKNDAEGRKTVTQRKTSWRKVLIGMISLMVMVGVIACIYIHENNEEVVPMEELTKDADWRNSEADDFSLDW